MFRSIFLLTSSLAIVIALMVYFFWSELPHGNQPIEAQVDYLRFFIIVVTTYFGVISNGVYDRLTEGQVASLFRRTDIVFASVIAPVVILPIYKSLGDIPDPIIVGLTAYQNGFFFNVIFDKLRKSGAKTEKA